TLFPSFPSVPTRINSFSIRMLVGLPPPTRPIPAIRPELGAQVVRVRPTPPYGRLISHPWPRGAPAPLDVRAGGGAGQLHGSGDRLTHHTSGGQSANRQPREGASRLAVRAADRANCPDRCRSATLRVRSENPRPPRRGQKEPRRLSPEHL